MKREAFKMFLKPGFEKEYEKRPKKDMRLFGRN